MVEAGQHRLVEVPPLPSLRAPAPVATDGGPGWPCTTCGQDNPLQASACTACGLPFLGGRDAAVPRLALPVVGDLGRLSRGQRVVAAGAVLLLGVLLLLLLSAVAGALLTDG